MRSQIDPRKPQGRSLRRLARRHARAATKLLQGEHPLAGRTIHAVRKQIKRLRAVCLLAEDAGARGVTRERRRLARAGAQLSAVRDMDVMEETLNALASANPALIPRSERHSITQRIHSARHDLRRTCRKKKTVRVLTTALARIEKRMAGWHPHKSDTAVWSPGLTRAHRRVCEALHLAAQNDDAVLMHTLRKRLTVLRNQLLVVAPAGSQPYRDAETLDAAVSALGDDHNLAVLWKRLSKWAEDRLIELDTRSLQRAVARRQRSLRKKAFVSVRPICRTPARRYVQRVEKAWKHASSAGTSLRVAHQAPVATGA